MTSLTPAIMKTLVSWNERKKMTGAYEKNSWKILSWVSLVLLVILWQWAGSRQLVNTSILPKPTLILEKLADMILDGSLVRYTLVSLKRVFLGYCLGGGIGLVFGFMIGLNRRLEQFINLYIGILRPIPPIAWIPFLILALGIGELSKITVIAIGSFWPLLLNTIEGVHVADESLLELGSVLEKDRKTVIFKIILPSAVPSVFTGARLGISRAWSCVVTAEMIAASAGVGYLIQYARELSQPAVMLVGVAVIGLIGLLIDSAMMAIQHRLLKWNSLR